MIKKLGEEITYKEISLDDWSFLCDKCGVLIGTCFDFGYNDDYAVAEKKVDLSVIICGKCRGLK